MDHSIVDFTYNGINCIDDEPGCGVSRGQLYPRALTSPIIAGDGYAYVAYQYEEDKAIVEEAITLVTIRGDTFVATKDGSGAKHLVTHLMLLRVGSDGSSSNIHVQDWESISDASWSVENGSYHFVTTGHLPYSIRVSTPITNTDKGVLLSWAADVWWYCPIMDNSLWGLHLSCNASAPPVSTYGIAVTSGSDISVHSVNIPGQATPIAPLLQTQDGTFVGTFGIGPSPADSGEGDFPITQSNMIAFDSLGNIKWTVPSFNPLRATSDGGIVARSVDGVSTATFDANGNATGQLSSPLTESWTGNAYQLGSVELVETTPTALADSFAAMVGGNPSGTGTYMASLTGAMRTLFAQHAISYIGSERWLDKVDLLHPENNLNKCNLFVHDMISTSMWSDPPASDVLGSRGWRMKYYLGLADSRYYPAQAGDWANGDRIMACWKVVGMPPDATSNVFPSDLAIPGDILAERITYLDATGHVGIVGALGNTVSADSAVECYAPPAKPGTITNSDYGFRADNWIDDKQERDSNGQVVPCRTKGKKRNAVVRRFVCY